MLRCGSISYNPAVGLELSRGSYRLHRSRGISVLRTPRLALAMCAVSVGGLSFSGAPASAAGGKPPVIVSMSEGIGGDVTVGADINPEGLETSYEIKLESSTQRSVGELPADYEGHEVRLTLTSLQPGDYRFSVRATNSAGETFQRSEILEVPAGSPCPEGCGNIERYEPRLESWVNESIGKWGEGATAREAARQQAEHVEPEIPASAADQPPSASASTPASPLAPISQPTPMRGNVSLVDTAIAVLGDSKAFVQLKCSGSESCHGKLTLSAKPAGKASKPGSTHTTAIGAVSFSIAGDRAATAKVALDPLGRSLLSADHGRLRATLMVIELSPSPESSQTRAVHLIRQGPGKDKH